jgi:hypothetical protein
MYQLPLVLLVVGTVMGIRHPSQGMGQAIHTHRIHPAVVQGVLDIHQVLLVFLAVGVVVGFKHPSEGMDRVVLDMPQIIPSVD